MSRQVRYFIIAASITAALCLSACGLKPREVDSHRGKPLPPAVPAYPNGQNDPAGTLAMPPSVANAPGLRPSNPALPQNGPIDMPQAGRPAGSESGGPESGSSSPVTAGPATSSNAP